MFFPFHSRRGPVNCCQGTFKLEAQNNSHRRCDRLEGLVPVVEDWHAKRCLLTVSF